MEIDTRTKVKRRRVEEKLDPVSRLCDDNLRDIISLLPDGRCTRDLSREWRRLWRSTPLSLDLLSVPIEQQHSYVSVISRILEEHPGRGRRFCIDLGHSSDSECNAGILDGWLQSRALHELQELKLDLDYFHRIRGQPPPPLPASVQRFWSTLCVASFTDCSFPGGNSTCSLQLPLLEQLSLSHVSVSDIDLHALLAACPVLQSLLLYWISGCSQVEINSDSLRSIGVGSGPGDLILQEFKVEAPCLSRLFFLGGELTISVTSETELKILGPLYAGQPHYVPKIEFGTTVLQGPSIHNLDVEMRSVKILAVKDGDLSLDVVIGIMRCFPCLEKLFIEANGARKKNEKLTNTTDIDHLKKIVVRNYQGNNSHVNFAKFFLKYAKGLESMRLELEPKIKGLSSEWKEEQHRLLDINNSASKNARLDFVTATNVTGSLYESLKERVHDLSTADPFGIY